MTEAYSQESGDLLDTGELVVIDNRVDPSTATVQLKARFANTKRRLWPGQLLNVKLALETVHDAIVLPSIAVNQGPNGPFTYVVENDVAVMRPVQFDVQQDEMTVIKSGLKPGDAVVVEGQGSLRPGAKVSVRGAPPGDDRCGEQCHPPAGMNISAPFIRRPVATSLIAAALLGMGLIAYFKLPVAALPAVDAPTIQISANLPGASPETMASNVATPLERQLSLVTGITQMTSNSNLGSTSITLQFDFDRNIDAAAQDVQAAISAAGGQLPTNMPSPPVMRKVNPADNSVLVIAMTSDTVPINIVSDYADNIVAQQISRMNGVGQVNLGGPRKPAIRIQIDPRKVAALGLQLDSIRNTLSQGTVNAPKGQLLGNRQTLTVYTNDQALDAKTWNELIVGNKNGAPIRVRDLGNAIIGVENTQGGAYSAVGKGGKYETLKDGPAVHVVVFKQPGANVIDTVDAVKAALPTLRAAVPPSINMNVVADRTLTIRASVEEVKRTLLITIVLVVAVLFLFLRNAMATAIPSAVIPVSLLATAAVMLPAKFSLDNLSLMALTIGVGFVVDDAIVMVEAIWRRIEHGEQPFEAALAGSREICFTILNPFRSR